MRPRILLMDSNGCTAFDSGGRGLKGVTKSRMPEVITFQDRAFTHQVTIEGTGFYVEATVIKAEDLIEPGATYREQITKEVIGLFQIGARVQE